MNQPKSVKTTKTGQKHTTAATKYGPRAAFSWRRRLLPPAIGIVVMLAVMAALNGQLIMAQLKYHFSHPAVIVGSAVPAANAAKTGAVDDTKSPHPELGPRLTIPAIGVEAPVIFEPGTAEWQIQIALRSGVVHYGQSVQPGDTGNVVMFGHSSGQPWAPGKYKFVFTLLDKLKKDNVIYVDNGGTRYTYEVVRSQVVKPTDTGVLNGGSDHELTLITCTPVGTSTNRLVVHAEQISPKPTTSKADNAADKTPASTGLHQLPGSAGR